MKAIHPRTAESIVVSKYKKLYECLIDLVTAMNVAEPAGILEDNIVIMPLENGKIRVAYDITPIQLVVDMPERQFILRVVERRPGTGKQTTRKRSAEQRREVEVRKDKPKHDVSS